MSEEKREYRELDEATKLLLAGYMPIPKDCRIPFTPQGFKGIKEAPIFFLRPYSPETMEKRRSDDGRKIGAVREYFKAGEGLVGFEATAPDGKPVPYNVNTLNEVLADGLVLLLDAEIVGLTMGPSKEELEGLESSPPST